MLLGGEVYAQGITVDGRLSPAQTLSGPNYAIGAGLGRQVGGNLFHSFGMFGLKGGETATFSGSPSVGNVIGRVTGGAASSIDGGIRSTIPGANLYLVNPAGVVFGPNASVDVGGSFHASSADYLRMKDGTRFQATNPNGSTLSAAPPEAFGFLSASPQPVTVNGSNLQLAPRNTLGVVGGPVTISGGRLYAPSGTVHVASAAGPGEVPVDPRAGPPPTVARSGRVQVANNASILASGENGGTGGSVFIRAGDLSVSASDIGADNGGPGPGGVLSLHGDRTVTISNGATVRADAIGTGRGADLSISTAAGGTMVLDAARIRTVAFAAGDGGTVAINTGALTLRNGAVVVSQAQDRGGGGPITVAADSVLLDGTGTNFGSGSFGAGAGGSVSVVAAQDVTIRNDANIQANTSGMGAGGSIGIVAARNVTISGSAVVSSAAEGSAATVVVGDVTITANGALSLGQNSVIAANSLGANNAPTIRITAGEMTVADGASVQGLASSTGRGADILINVAGNFSLTGTGTTPSNVVDDSSGPGNAGNVTINAGALTLSRGGAIGSTAGGSGNAGEITLNIKGPLTIDGAGSEGLVDGVTSAANPESSGLAGTVRVSAGSVSLANGGTITSSTQGTGAGGSVLVTTPGALLLDGNRSDYTQITASALGRQSGDAGPITITAGSVTVQNGARIASSTSGLGRGGGMTVNAGALNLVGGGTITSNTFGSGNAGEIALNVTGPLVIDGAHEGGFTTGVSSDAYLGTSGAAGPVQVNAANVSLLNGGSIDSRARGVGVAGSIVISTPGALLLDGGGGTTTEVAVSARGRQSGNAGTIMVGAGTVAVQNGAQITGATSGPGRGGGITVNTGALTLAGGGSITTNTAGFGDAGEITLKVAGPLVIDGAGKKDYTTNGVSSGTSEGAPGSAGSVRVSAGSVTIANGGFINSNTNGASVGGLVLVKATGTLLLDGGGAGGGNSTDVGASSGLGFTEIGASSQGPQSGNAGTVSVSAGTIAVQNGARIASATNGTGGGGDVAVHAGILTLARGGTITSDTFGSGAGGMVTLTVDQALTIDGAGRGGFANGVSSAADAGSSGPAGTVQVNAGSLSVLNGGTITSSTTGTGVGGSVLVAVPGALLLDGGGTAIGASALGPRSGDAGTVTVNAGTATVQNGAQITSSTVGPGRGGNVDVTASSAVRLVGSGPQITATSTGTGNAGSITVSAPQVDLSGGASVSTAAQAANGGNITIGPGDLLYLRDSSITTSVNSAFGNGGNITVDPRLVVLDRSVIEANAVGGAGGNVLIRAREFVQSADSAVTATSLLGVSGQIFIVGPLLDLNSTLVVLASDLRSTAALLREGCAARGAGPRSSLVVAGRGGQRQGLEATLPALYFAHRPVRDGERRASQAPAAETSIAATSAAPVRTSVSLSSRCG